MTEGRQGRPPSASELWAQRCKRAEARLNLEQRLRHFHLMQKIMCVLGQETSIIDGRSAPNPHYRNPVRERELWEQIGEFLGIGPPPPGWSAMRAVPPREPEGALPAAS
jgi:hypothetical protein